MNESQPNDPHQWFADKNVEVSLFRINRRELDPKRPAILPRFSEDLLTHVQAALREAGPVTTRHEGREWNIGNVELHQDNDENFITARIGVAYVEASVASVFDSETKEWTDSPIELPRSYVTAIVILGKSRLVGIAPSPGIHPILTQKC